MKTNRLSYDEFKKIDGKEAMFTIEGDLICDGTSIMPRDENNSVLTLGKKYVVGVLDADKYYSAYLDSGDSLIILQSGKKVES